MRRTILDRGSRICRATNASWRRTPSAARPDRKCVAPGSSCTPTRKKGVASSETALGPPCDRVFYLSCTLTDLIYDRGRDIRVLGHRFHAFRRTKRTRALPASNAGQSLIHRRPAAKCIRLYFRHETLTSIAQAERPT